MVRSRIWRWMQMAALGTALCLACGSLAWSYDDDDYQYHRDEAREHGYRNGYNDGIRAGQYDRDRGARFRFKNDQWEDAHGYQHWMGSHGRYKEAYRRGYEEGYESGYGAYGYRRGDRGDYRWHDRDDWR